MSQRIANIKANPLLAMVGALFFGVSHWLINGQRRKMLVLGLLTVLGTLGCVVPGVVMLALSTLEAYQTAAKLAVGQTVHKNAYSLFLCYRVARLIDKKATYEAVPTIELPQ